MEFTRENHSSRLVEHRHLARAWIVLGMFTRPLRYQQRLKRPTEADVDRRQVDKHNCISVASLMQQVLFSHLIGCPEKLAILSSEERFLSTPNSGRRPEEDRMRRTRF